MSDDFIPKDCLTSITYDYGFFMDILGSGRCHINGLAFLCYPDV